MALRFGLFGPILLVGAVLILGCDVAVHRSADDTAAEMGPATVRVALFNVRELRREKIDTLDENGRGADPQLLAAASIIERVAPDILVLQEVDHGYPPADDDLAGPTRRFVENYLPAELSYPFVYAAPNNTGILSGVDLDGDGHVADEGDRGRREHGNDSFGYGTYPGEYSMAVLSRLPLLSDRARTFQRLPWRELPGHHIPPDHFGEDALARLRLSSKSHWDLPVALDAGGGGRLHLLVSHPTPPGFDGDEDKNGRRNFDELLLWKRYLDGDPAIVDDAGRSGGLPASAPFIVVGDLNAAPAGETRYDGISAIDQLLLHPRIFDPAAHLTSRGAIAHDREHAEPTATAVFGSGTRIDYLLPGRGVEVVDGGVFWPDPELDPRGAAWAATASDHRLVWLDLLPRAERESERAVESDGQP